MGRALLNGLLSTGLYRPGDLHVANPHTDKLEDLRLRGVNVSSSNAAVAKDADLLVVAVKPWIVGAVASELSAAADLRDTQVCVIAAGVPGDELKRMFGVELRGLCLAMPNTALAVGKSMTFIVPLSGESPAVLKVFGETGRVQVVEESRLPALTALASCGIAYAMRYARAAVEGGVELGVRASEGQQIVAQTISGAMALLEQPGAHPETEIDKVTTPGGITIRGLNAMEKAGFTAAVIEGLKASAK